MQVEEAELLGTKKWSDGIDVTAGMWWYALPDTSRLNISYKQKNRIDCVNLLERSGWDVHKLFIIWMKFILFWCDSLFIISSDNLVEIVMKSVTLAEERFSAEICAVISNKKYAHAGILNKLMMVQTDFKKPK